MGNKRTIEWILKAKDSVSKKLNTVAKRFSTFAKRGKALLRPLAKGFTVLAGAIAGVVAVSAKLVKAYHTQAQAEAKLRSVLKSTGYAAQLTSTELKKYAAELQKLTGYGDEVIISAMGILATFKNIKGDQFKATTKAVLDMSTVLQKAGQDSNMIEQAVIQVGKAMNDPILGMSALNRVGIQFTHQQKSQAKALIQSGNLMGAQEIILKELQEEFGGAAEGIDKNVKSWKRLKNSVGDAAEKFGEALTNSSGLTDGLNSLSDAIDRFAESDELMLWADRVVAAFRVLGYTLENAGKGIEWIVNAVGSVGSIFHASEKDVADMKTTIAELEEELSQLNPNSWRAEQVRNGLAKNREMLARWEADVAKQKSSKRGQYNGSYFDYLLGVPDQTLRDRKKAEAARKKAEAEEKEKRLVYFGGLISRIVTGKKRDTDKAAEDKIKLFSWLSPWEGRVRKGLKEIANKAVATGKKVLSAGARQVKRFTNETIQAHTTQNQLQQKKNDLINREKKLREEIAKQAKVDAIQQKIDKLMYRDKTNSFEEKLSTFISNRNRTNEIEASDDEVRKREQRILKQFRRGRPSKKDREWLKNVREYRANSTSAKTLEDELKDLQNSQIEELKNIKDQLKTVNQKLEKNLQAAGG